jgi:hypothetical protein
MDAAIASATTPSRTIRFKGDSIQITRGHGPMPGLGRADAAIGLTGYLSLISAGARAILLTQGRGGSMIRVIA